MTNEERDELRAALEAAGCPYLANAIGGFLGGAYIEELRSLLRREKIRRYEESIAWAIENYDDMPPELQALIRRLAQLLGINDGETEVPDGQG